MSFAGFLPRRVLPVAVVVASAAGLSGCFDLAQNMAVRRDGSGTYAVSVTAEGMVGKALNKHNADIDLNDDGDNHAVTHIARNGDKVTQVSEVVFRDLSDLKFGDEKTSMHVLGKNDSGTQVSFHRTFQIDHARKDHDQDDDEGFGRDVLHSIFGDHTYTFSVWLPGSVQHIAPLRVNDQVVHPTVWADKYGHTILWKMPLVDIFLADQIDFDVTFAANGTFHDTQTSPGQHHKHRKHHDNDDDDDDDDNG